MEYLWPIPVATFWGPKNLVTFMQKSCFLGPTIFKIPQPNWCCIHVPGRKIWVNFEAHQRTAKILVVLGLPKI